MPALKSGNFNDFVHVSQGAISYLITRIIRHLEEHNFIVEVSRLQQQPPTLEPTNDYAYDLVVKQTHEQPILNLDSSKLSTDIDRLCCAYRQGDYAMFGYTLYIPERLHINVDMTILQLP